MPADDRDLVSRLLKQSILTLCREAVNFRCRLEVDGIICLTADDQAQHVVKIHELFNKGPLQNDTDSKTLTDPNLTESFEDKAVGFRSIIRYATNSQIGANEIPNNDKMLIKSEQLDTIRPENIERQAVTVPDDTVQEKVTIKYVDALANIDYASMGLDKFVKSSAKNIHCKKCNATIEDVASFQVHNMSSHGQFTCLVCLGTFTSKNNMKRHIRLHTGIKPYSCHKCPESFSRNDDFKRHLLKHTFQKSLRCTVCNGGFTDRSCVKAHMIKEHYTKVFHVCPQCGECYIDLHEFQQHKRSHPEFQDYRCSICSFTGSNALMYHKHMLTHGPQKEFKCTHCKVSYSDPFLYTGHLKQHRGDEFVQHFRCCFCNVSLTSFDLFQRHENTHVHSTHHICNQCNKVFRYPSNLREHMLTHLPCKDAFSPRGFLGNGSTKHLLIDSHLEKGNDSSTDMEIDEENNNQLSTGKEDVDDERDDGHGSSEYWCTECNQGFASEGKLKAHILYKHEARDDFDDVEERSVDERRLEGDNHENTYNFLDIAKQNLPIELKNAQVQSNVTLSISSPTSSENDLSDEHGKYIDSGKVLQDDAVAFSVDSKQKVIQITHQKHTGTGLKELKEDTLGTNSLEDYWKLGSSTGTETIILTRPEVDDRTTEDDGDSVEHNSSFSFISKSNDSASHDINSYFDTYIPVSISGMKLKIKKTSHFTTTIGDKKELNVAEQKYDDNLLQVKKDNDESIHYIPSSGTGVGTDNRATQDNGSSTTLNLQIRNPGFERVVTPDILFKTKAPFTCEVCQETYTSFDDFHDHGVKVHRRFICSYCGKVFTSRPNRERHIRYHTGEKPYKCDICATSFLRGDDLKYHRTTKHSNTKSFTCGACNASFTLPRELEKHFKMYADHKLLIQSKTTQCE